MRFKASNITWGVCLLFVAAFILVNQFSDFARIGIGSIIAIIMATAFIAQSVIRRRFSELPIPLAVLYLVLQSPLGLPTIRILPMLIAAVLASAGLEYILPGKQGKSKEKQ